MAVIAEPISEPEGFRGCNTSSVPFAYTNFAARFSAIAGANDGVRGLFPIITEAGRGDAGYPTIDAGRLAGGEMFTFREDVGFRMGPFAPPICGLAERTRGARAMRRGCSDGLSSDAPSAWKNLGPPPPPPLAT
jgi:hypothetical protein